MTSRRALLATSYIWTVKYTTIVVDSPFDSTADLYAATNEAIASDTFAAYFTFLAKEDNWFFSPRI